MKAMALRALISPTSVAMPATCPIRWSARDHHGHPRTDQQAARSWRRRVAASLISRQGELGVSSSLPESISD